MPGEFIDTNIVIYSLSQDDKKQDKALALLVNKPVISIQVLNETANIMRRKLGFDVSVIRVVINRISQECGSLQPINLTTINKALNIFERYEFSYYDSLIIAAALQADCTALYSEDMHHGQSIDNQLIIINPFL
jgi:predicted nucleic acid-binding protein